MVDSAVGVFFCLFVLFFLKKNTILYILQHFRMGLSKKKKKKKKKDPQSNTNGNQEYPAQFVSVVLFAEHMHVKHTTADSV